MVWWREQIAVARQINKSSLLEFLALSDSFFVIELVEFFGSRIRHVLGDRSLGEIHFAEFWQKIRSKAKKA